MLDPAGHVASWNRGSERIKGYTADEIIGRHFSRFYTPEDAASGKPQRGLQTAVAEGFFEEEGVRVRKDGSRFWASVNITPLYDQASKHVGFLKVARDITVRKALEGELQEAARFNRATLDGLSAHIAILDEDGTIAAVNRPWDDFAAANGLASGAASIGANYLTVCDRSSGPYADEGPVVAAGIRAVLAGSIPQFFAEYPCDSPAENRWFVVRVTPFPGNGRRRVIVAHENITACKESEETLRAERDRFEKIVTAVPVVICSFLQRPDGTSCFPFANPAIEEIYGYRLEDLALDAAPIFTRIHPDDVVWIRGTLDDCARTLTPWKGEFRVRNPTRGEIWVEGHVIPSAEPDGGILWQGYIADITERRRADEEFRRQHAELQVILDSVQAIIFYKDRDSRFVRVNRSLAEMVGLPAEAFVGKSDADLGSPFAEQYRADDLQVMTTGIPVKHREERLQTRDGVRWLLTDKVAHRDHTGRVIGVIGFALDITAHKQAEAALRETEARLRGAFEHTNVAMVITDIDNRFLQANAAFARLFGYTTEEVLRLSMADLTHPDHLAESLAGREVLMAGEGDHFEMEKRYLRKDGSVIWGLTNVSLLRDARGRPFQYVGQVQDITERKRADDARNLFRALLDRSNDAIEVIDLDTGGFLDANETAYRSLGYTREEYLTLGVPDINPSVAESGWAAIADEIRRAGSIILETRHRRKDGTTLPVEVNAKLIRADREYSVAVVRDITERKRAEAASRQLEQRLTGILNSAMDGIITVGEDQCVIQINAAAERMFGCRAEDVMGQSVDRFIPERFRAGHAEHIRDFGRTGIAARVMGMFGPISGLRSNGEEFPIEASISQLQVEAEKLFTVTCRDVTERVRAAEARRKLEAQLHQSQKMEAFGQLAGGVAHDFNNLLTVISGYSDLLLLALPPDDASREFVGEIRHAGERAASLTRQLLAFSRQQILDPRVLDLNGVVADTERMLRRLIGEDVQLTTVLRPTIGSVRVDPGQIEQVVMNLAVNARDAMPQGGKLTIETSEVELDESYALSHAEVRPGRFVVLAVSDTGCGMTPDVKARLFEPFFTTKGVGKGTGLGLAVVHGIVKQSGGSIEVYSEVGAGTAFKVYLPAVQEQPASLSNPGLAVSPRGSETILLVEDEDGVRKFATFTLEGFGYTVLTTAGGEDALALMATHEEEIDLLVTDVVMPEMSGRRLAETLQAKYPRLKVLFLSGYTDDAIVRHGVLQADVAFLQKPFTPSALAKKVREVLDQH